MKAGTPGAPHKALADTAGNYDVKVKSWQAPGGPAMEETGTVTRSMVLDGRVLVEEFKGSMMGMPFTGHGMRGYDNVTGKYWGTWMDSMSTGMMVSEGTCDAKNACTFTGSWNDPIKKGPITSRMASRWTSPTTEVFEMYVPGRDGKEFKMMEPPTPRSRPDLHLCCIAGACVAGSAVAAASRLDLPRRFPTAKAAGGQ
jgi:hypothetical protein